MANYYTYGTIPNAEETVYGPLSQGYAEGGEVDEAVPADRGLPEEPYYNDPVYTEETPAEYIPNLFVEGADVPASIGLNMGALDQLFANLRKTEELQKMALEPGLLQQGFTGATGVTAPPMGTGIYVPKAAPSGPAIDFEVTPEMAGALQEVARPAEITAAERAAVQENPRVQALSRISGLLEADDFAGAFNAALQAEQDLGGDFIGNLVDPNKMKMLRGPMDAQEITKFYNEMPQKVFEERYLGPGNEFKKEQAIERNIAALGGEAGYVDPTLGVKKEETLLGKLPIKELAALAAAAMGATAIPGLFGAGSASGAGAGAGAAGAGGAGAAGATGAGALTGVIPSGLIPGAVSAAGLGTATFPIIAGAGLTGAQLAALGAGALGAGSLASSGGASSGAATSGATTPQPPLEEVVVTASKPSLSSLLGLGAVAVPTTTPVDLPKPEIVNGQVTYPDQSLEEVVVTANRPPLENLLGLGTVALPTTTAVDLPQPEVVDGRIQYPDQDLEEVVVTANRPPLESLLGLGAVAVPTTTPVDLPQPEIVDGRITYPENDLEEVVVTANRPPLEKLLGLGALALPTTTPVDLPQPEVVDGRIQYPESDLEEVIVKGTPPTPDGLNLPPFTIPLKTPVDLSKPKINEPSVIKDLIDKYGSVENALKLLGALGSAFSKAPKTPTGGAGIGTGGGMGGALPKYNYARQQLSPDIDYYTYGTRPEAKFFEDKLQLEKPVQPELPPAKPPEPDMVMATGGLTGYAKGGSKSSRYVDGPGSGREDKIPALLSDGEYVIDAETLALLGDGSTKEGARRMDKFRANIRKHKGRALSRGRISPNAKSPDKYMGGGLT
jgi:hypothetical protein